MSSEPLILNIETATTVCSVALSKGVNILALKEYDGGYTHAENLHLFIGEVMESVGLRPADLDAIALSSGPGSYTGLRIGSSTAKGLCFALDKPLITIGTLEAMAAGVLENISGNTVVCAMLDAGRMEVYTAVFGPGAEILLPVQALILDENTVKVFENWAPIHFTGSGVGKAKELLGAFNPVFSENNAPSARHMAKLTSGKFKAGQFTDPITFEPFYLKNYIAGKPRKPTF